VSGDRDVSYADAALIGARKLGVSEELVRPVFAGDTGRFKESVPENTTLNADRLMEELGVVPPDAEWTIGTAFTR